MEVLTWLGAGGAFFVIGLIFKAGIEHNKVRTMESNLKETIKKSEDNEEKNRLELRDVEDKLHSRISTHSEKLNGSMGQVLEKLNEMDKKITEIAAKQEINK